MKTHRRFRALRPKHIRFLIALTVSLTVLVFLEREYLKFTERIEFYMQDRLMQYRNRNHTASEDVIALIFMDDEATVWRYKGAPPPRMINAELVCALHQSGAKVIAFDSTFDMDREGTDALIEASKQVDQLIYGIALDEYKKNDNNDSETLRGLVPFNLRELNQAPKKDYSMDRIPWQTLRPYVEHVGHLMFRVSPDGLVRHIPMVVQVGEQHYPALSLIAACLFMDVPFDGSGVIVKWEKYILLDNHRGWKRRIPIDKRGRIRINYIGDIDRFEQRYSFSNLERALDAEMPLETVFSKKLVLIGNEVNQVDRVLTPFSKVFPGIAVHASAIDNILRGEFVYETSASLAMCLVFCFIGSMALLQFLLQNQSQRKQHNYWFQIVVGFIIFAGAVATYSGTVYLWFYFRGGYLDVLSPLAGLFVAYISVGFYCYVERLRQEYAYRKTITQNMGNGLMVLDNQGRITSLNQKTAMLLNINENEVLGKHVREAFGKDLPEMVDKLTKALDLEKGSSVRFPLKTATYEIEVSLSYGSELVDDRCRVIAVITDMTDIRSLERKIQLQQRQAAYSQLASELNHRVKNSLQTVRLDIDKLKRRIGSDKSIETIIERSTRQINSLEELATNFKRGISTYEQVKNGRWVESNLNQIIRDLLKDISQSVSENIQVHAQFCEGLPPLRIEADWFWDALQNLVSNALDAMPEGGQLTVKTEILPANKVLITIRDTGEGISNEDKPKIFVPWFTRKEGGSGMGLYMVQQIMMAHNGEIEFESQKGKGTEFRLFLPTA